MVDLVDVGENAFKLRNDPTANKVLGPKTTVAPCPLSNFFFPRGKASPQHGP